MNALASASSSTSPYPLTPSWRLPSPADSPVTSETAAQEWRYEMRREAQEIIPHLYLGPFQSSTNLARLHSMGITHILCIRDRKEAALIFPRYPTEFKYMTLDISDNMDQNIITEFPQCKAFIEEALKQGGTVLAHCNGGISLSPAIIIGYLMWKFNWTFDHALGYVQSKRYCVSPMSFQIQLKEYEPIYLAQKMVEAQGYASGRGGNKRGMSDDEDDEEEDYHHRRQPPQPGAAMEMDTDG